jgi:MoaA/NifB/PqqE/SkfB family radical SAM enzyme
MQSGFNMLKKIHQRLAAQLSLRTGLSVNKPTYVCAKMTMQCNSRCVHCNIWQMPFESPELTTADWIRVLEQLRSWLGRFRMVFTGGEALLKDDMVRILGHAAGLGIHVELLSNGIMLDASLARRIVSIGIKQVTLSYESVTPEIHDRFRGGVGFHSATTAAILQLVRERNIQKVPLRILLKTVISSENLFELAAVAQWADEQGVEVQYQPIEQNYGDAYDPMWYLRSPLWIMDIDSLKNEIELLKAIKLQGRCIISNNHEDFDFFLHYFRNPETLMNTVQSHDSRSRSHNCSSAVGNFVIESNGDVRMCFRMKPIGNVARKPPATIWSERQRCWMVPCDYR